MPIKTATRGTGMRDHTTGPLRRRKGQSTVETALVIVIFLAMIYGIMEVSRLVFINAEIENAAREGARYASLRAGVPTATLPAVIAASQAEARKRLVLTGSIPDPVVAFPTTPACPDGRCTFSKVSVTVVYTWTSAIAFVPQFGAGELVLLKLGKLGPIELRS